MLPLALIVVILGGTGSLLGALVGSFLIGFLYNFGQAMFPDLAYVILFLPMLLVLVLRPQGLFGTGGAVSATALRRAAIALALVVLRDRCRSGSATPTTSTSPARSCCWAVFALALNVLVGYAGLVSLGPRRPVRHGRLRRGAAARTPATATSSPIPAALVVTRRDCRDLRRAGAARHRHRLPDDHAGARPDPVGHRLSLGEPHQRRQRHQRGDAGRRRSASAWPRRRPSTTRRSSCSWLRRRHAWLLFVRSPFGASLARHARPGRGA